MRTGLSILGTTAHLLLILGGCTGSEGVPQLPLDSVLEWVGSLRLEETDSVVNADPVLSPDPLGGFIVADKQTNQVRLYDLRGRLRGWFGGEGPGPAEFEELIDAARGARGRVAALTHEGKMSVWSPRGDSLLEVRNVPNRGSSITPFGDGWAVTALPLALPGDVAVLHVLGPEAGVDEAVVEPHVTEESSVAFFSVGLPSVTGLGSEKAVTVPLFDSIWVVDENSVGVVERVAVPSTRLAGNAPPVRFTEERTPFFDWLHDTWFVEAAHPLEEGGWLVSLWHATDAGEKWALVRIDQAGRARWESGGVPHLMTVDGEGRLIFDDPESPFPNRLRVARLRSSGAGAGGG